MSVLPVIEQIYPHVLFVGKKEGAKPFMKCSAAGCPATFTKTASFSNPLIVCETCKAPLVKNELWITPVVQPAICTPTVSKPSQSPKPFLKKNGQSSASAGTVEGTHPVKPRKEFNKKQQQLPKPPSGQAIEVGCTTGRTTQRKGETKVKVKTQCDHVDDFGGCTNTARYPHSYCDTCIGYLIVQHKATRSSSVVQESLAAVVGDWESPVVDESNMTLEEQRKEEW